MRYAMLGMMLLGGTALAAALPAPDPVSWEPASIAGPALFIGEFTGVEDFQNSGDVQYDCHAASSGDPATDGRSADGKQRGRICVSNSCGLERITFRPVQVLAGEVPASVWINNLLGEWCTSVSAPGRKFLVAILPDKHWSVSEVIEVQGKSFAVPDYTGCMGDVDLKPLLPKQGIELAAAGDRKQMAWRTDWHDEVAPGPCSEWIPQDQFQKVLPLATVTDSWKNKHP